MKTEDQIINEISTIETEIIRMAIDQGKGQKYQKQIDKYAGWREALIWVLKSPFK